ncbi:unnamed protein product [Prorocentrum cordatum]|uniref:Gamma-glutamylcyclotransferase n=1 Tax=Prorocentrum cordatum TaxID=2364126 RepID=A0ABN9QPB2_9DINO|nr:unnamed protein product [Polarella glacialis]
MRAALHGLALELLACGVVDGRGGSDLVDAVTLEVYYSPRCTRCWNFIQRNVVPLLEAGLPGDQVLVTVLPVPFTVLLPGDCVKDVGCIASVAPLCALSGQALHAAATSTPRPQPAEDAHGCERGPVPLHPPRALERDTVRNCAEVAGVPLDDIDDCIASRDVFDFIGERKLFGSVGGRRGTFSSSPLMHSKSYTDNALEALERIDTEGFEGHVGLPLVFLDGALLSCDGYGCSARKTPSGEEPLERPGSLLSVACASLRSPPEACRGAGADQAGLGAEPVDVSDRLPCENCAESGRFRWRAPGRADGPPGRLALAAGALAALPLALGAWLRGRRPPRGCSYEAAAAAELHSAAGENTKPWFLYGAEVDKETRERVFTKYNARDDMGKPINGWPAYGEGILTPAEIAEIERRNEYFKWESRGEKIVAELLKADADVISLVENDKQTYFAERLRRTWDSGRVAHVEGMASEAKTKERSDLWEDRFASPSTATAAIDDRGHLATWKTIGSWIYYMRDGKVAAITTERCKGPLQSRRQSVRALWKECTHPSLEAGQVYIPTRPPRGWMETPCPHHYKLAYLVATHEPWQKSTAEMADTAMRESFDGNRNEVSDVDQIHRAVAAQMQERADFYNAAVTDQEPHYLRNYRVVDMLPINRCIEIQERCEIHFGPPCNGYPTCPDFEGARSHAPGDVSYDEGSAGHHVPTNWLPQVEATRIARPPRRHPDPWVETASILDYGCMGTLAADMLNLTSHITPDVRREGLRMLGKLRTSWHNNLEGGEDDYQAEIQLRGTAYKCEGTVFMWTHQAYHFTPDLGSGRHHRKPGPSQPTSSFDSAIAKRRDENDFSATVD